MVYMNKIITRNIVKETANVYQDFFNFMSKEHGLILNINEMDEILYQSKKLSDKLKEYYER